MLGNRFNPLLLAGSIAAIFTLIGSVEPAIAQDSNPPSPTSPPSTEPARARKPRKKPAEPQPAEPASEQPDEPDAQPDPNAPAPAANTPPAKPGTKPAAPAKPAPAAPVGPITEPGPYLTRDKKLDLTLTVNVDVRPDRSDQFDNNKQPVITSFNFDTLTMVFPLASTETSNAHVIDRSLDGSLSINDRKISDTKPIILSNQVAGGPYHSGVRLLRWKLDAPTQCREIALDFTLNFSCYQTKFNEAEALKVDWPTGDWPPVAKSTFEPQIYIDYERGRDPKGPVQAFYERKDLDALVNAWAKGNPKGAKPVVLAKFFAGQVLTNFQISGSGLQYLHTGQLQGFDLQGPTQTIRTKRGSEYDICSTLVALYRAAGLPARVVVGIDEGTGPGNSPSFLNRNQEGQKLRCWVEFCLYDEPKHTVNWIPVDIVKMRASSSRPGPIEQPWAYFGTHDEMDRLVPLAFGFHPPTTVEAYGAPGLWGWLMTPQPPNSAYQGLRFRVDSTVKRGGDPKETKPTK